MEEPSVVPQQSHNLTRKLIFLTAWLLIFVLTFVWRLPNLDAFGLSNDEGAHLMWAQLALDGYPLYQETYAVQAPLFIEPIGWAFRLLGSTIQAGRTVSLIGFALLSIVMSWLAYRGGGRLASLLTVFLVGISPLLFTFSRRVMAEVPATALAVSALALVFVYLKRRHKGLLLASGLLLGASFITKALNPFLVAPVGFLLVGYHAGFSLNFKNWPAQLRHTWPALIVDLALWGGAICLPLSAVLLLYGPANVYDQLFAFRGDLRVARPGSWLETWNHVKIFFSSPRIFGLLAIGSIISTLLRLYVRSSQSDAPQHTQNSSNFLHAANSFVLYNLIWIIWLVAGVLMLMWHTPLFPHHFIVLLPPLILLASSLPSNLMALQPALKTGRPVAWAGLLLLLFLIGAALLDATTIVETNRKTQAIVTGGREQDALKLLAAVSNPADFVMGDSQLLIYMAARRTPPPLGDVALVAIQAGRQTSARMIALTEQYQSPAVVQWSLRLPWLPDYVTWVEANYLSKKVWDNDHLIYFGRRLAQGEPIPHEQFVPLGDSLVLRGFDVDPDSMHAGQPLQLKVYWQSEATLNQDYTVFTQLLDSSGRLVASQDSQPLAGYFPTSHWPPNEIITDIIALPLPDDLPPGQYTLITGMYLLETLERLQRPTGAGDYLNLTTIVIDNG